MGYAIILLYSIMIIYALSFRRTKAFKFLICICFFQNICLVCISRFIDEAVYTIITLLKEGYVILLFSKMLFKRRNTSKSNRNRHLTKDIIICLIFIFILICMMILSGKGDLRGQLSSLRQLYLPFFFYALGRISCLTNNELKDISKFYIKVCLIASGFGFLEYALGTSFWIPIGIGRYLELKGVGRYLLSNGMPTSFYSYDLGLGFRVRRMASVLVDPVIMGQLIAFALILSLFDDSLFKKKTNKRIAIVLLTVALLFCMAKGGIVIAVVSFCLLLKDVAKKKILSRILLACMFITLGLYFGFAIKSELSASNHYGGLISGIASLKNNPLGMGIGATGNLSLAEGLNRTLGKVGTESYIGSMIAQTGIMGICFNIYIFTIALSTKNFRTDISNDTIKVTRILLLSLLLTSFFNYTAISFTSCFIYFIYSGVTKRSGIQMRRFRGNNHAGNTNILSSI